MAWSAQQVDAFAKVAKWIKAPKGKLVFRLFGYAGTGKTTLAIEIANNVPGEVLFACFTGKAALVMRKKGCTDASTLHSLIYKIADPDAAEPTFILNQDSALVNAKLLIVDEVSMVDEELGRDLESFGVPILVLGDPMQLPPVRGSGYFIINTPDVMLTEIHRQAADNPIIRMSMDVREGRSLSVGHYGDSKIILRGDLDRDEVLQADQLLVGMNKTRKVFNSRMRSLKGYTDADCPEYGERLICLKNNREKGLLNGSMWEVKEAYGRDMISMMVHSLDDMADPGMCNTPVEFFRGTDDTLEWYQKKGVDEFCFGYAITVHKGQGSQWDHLMLFDESNSFRENRSKHLYTGITRAAERITIVL